MRDAVFEGQQLSAASDFLLYKIGAHGSSDREGRKILTFICQSTYVILL
jgi:hypothetical protein